MYDLQSWLVAGGMVAAMVGLIYLGATITRRLIWRADRRAFEAAKREELGRMEFSAQESERAHRWSRR